MLLERAEPLPPVTSLLPFDVGSLTTEFHLFWLPMVVHSLLHIGLQSFCSRWQITHVTSSPHHPQSNGHAEAAVKAMKTLNLKL